MFLHILCSGKFTVSFSFFFLFMDRFFLLIFMFALVSLVFFMSFLCSIAVVHPTQRYQTCLIKGYKDNFDIFLKVVYKGLFFVSSC